MIDVSQMIDIVYGAGEIILGIYNKKYNIEYKKDHSPVTEADKLANNYIVDKLKKYYSGYLILAEESEDDKSRIDSEYVWIVDPLDGTKEFISGNGEFTVNIGLVYRNYPAAGFVYTPVSGELYYAVKSEGAYKLENNGKNRILCSSIDNIENMRLIKSRSHSSGKLKKIIEDNKFKSVVESGSSKKICMIAENKADVYYRFNPTMEWDTCAGNAVIDESGGIMTDFNGARLIYNKPVPKNAAGFVCSNNIIHEHLLSMAEFREN